MVPNSVAKRVVTPKKVNRQIGNGWISSQIQQLLEAGAEAYEVSKARLEDREDVLRYEQPIHKVTSFWFLFPSPSH